MTIKTNLETVLNCLGNRTPLAMAEAFEKMLLQAGIIEGSIIDKDGWFAEVNMCPNEITSDRIYLWVEMDAHGHLQVTAKGKDFERGQGWVTSTVEGFFEALNHPHISVIGDTCHTHYTHLNDLVQWVRKLMVE